MQLRDVAARSAMKVWALGYSNSTDETFIFRWDGSRWSLYRRSPPDRSLDAVSAGGWVVGSPDPIALRTTADGWRSMPSASGVEGSGFDVASARPDKAVLVGAASTRGGDPTLDGTLGRFPLAPGGPTGSTGYRRGGAACCRSRRWRNLAVGTSTLADGSEPGLLYRRSCSPLP